MYPENDWQPTRGDRGERLAGAGLSAVRVALLFGSAAVALALILTPVADRQTRSLVAQSGELDVMTTGSIGSAGSYTIRKSVLQPSVSSVCIRHDNGRRAGEC